MSCAPCGASSKGTRTYALNAVIRMLAEQRTGGHGGELLAYGAAVEEAKALEACDVLSSRRAWCWIFDATAGLCPNAKAATLGKVSPSALGSCLWQLRVTLLQPLLAASVACTPH